MSLDEINKLRVAAALDVEPRSVTKELVVAVARAVLREGEVDHG